MTSDALLGGFNTRSCFLTSLFAEYSHNEEREELDYPTYIA